MIRVLILYLREIFEFRRWKSLRSTHRKQDQMTLLLGKTLRWELCPGYHLFKHVIIGVQF
jgi:hypothetical protein